MQNTSEVADDLSKCCIKEVEKQPIDSSSAIPMSRLPLQAPQNIQGVMIDFSIHFDPSLSPVCSSYLCYTHG